MAGFWLPQHPWSHALNQGVGWWRASQHILDAVAPGFFLDVLNQQYSVGNHAAALADLLTITNASAIRTYIDQSGVMRTAAANAPRIDWSSGKPELLLEGAATNSLVQSGNAGAAIGVIGSGGAWPTNYKVSSAGPLTISITAVGTTGGVPWTEARIYGTNSTGSTIYVEPQHTTRPTAASGQTWSGSMWSSLVAGAWPNDSAAGKLQVVEMNGSAFRAGSAISTIAGWARYTVSRTFSDNLTNNARISIGFAVAAGEVVDCTFRMGALQLEQSPAPTSYIPTTSTAVTRTADLCQLSASAAAILQGAGAAVAWRGNVPVNGHLHQLIDSVGGSYLRQDNAALMMTGSAAGGDVTLAASGLPGIVAACIGWGASGRRGSQAGAAALASAGVVDRSLASVYIGPSTGLDVGQIIRLRQLVGWPLPDRPSSSGVQAQARIAA